MGYTLKNIKSSPFEGLDYSYITSDFGNRTFYNDVTKKYDSNFHNGIDMTSGTNIVAAATGKVTGIRNNINGYTTTYGSGNHVILYHGNNIYTVYYHMKYGSIKVKAGDIVKKGELLGVKGATGYATGPHLHFGVEVNNQWVDPKDYLLGKKIIPNYGDIINTEITNTNDIKYIVKRGDTLSAIASLYNTTYQELAKYNNIENPNLIITGQVIYIPNFKTKNADNNITYIVKSGDTLWDIANKYNTTWQKIYKDNENVIGSNPNLIIPGQKLTIKR